MNKSIKSFKLVGGDEIVAEIVRTALGTAAQNWVIKRPLAIKFQPMGQGQIGLALVPWALSNPTIDELHLPEKAVIAQYEPSATVERQYLQQTSGIELSAVSPLVRP